MPERRMPDWLRHTPVPKVGHFAILAGLDAATRGILISSFPILMYKALGNAERVSEIYFVVGICSLIGGLLVPYLARFVARRFIFSLGTIAMGGGAIVAGFGDPVFAVSGLISFTIGVVFSFVCFNAYVMDYIERSALRDLETRRMFYSGFSWMLGPALGVYLMEIHLALPFIVSGVSSAVLLAVFWYYRISDSRQIARAKAPSPNPLAFLARFFVQPRLVSGWIFAVVRSCGWWVYIVYLPIYAIESGYSDKLGGLLLSTSNAFLFLTPLMLKWMKRHSVRTAVRVGFAVSSIGFALASLVPEIPMLVLGLLVVATFFLVLLDVSAGLPFLMAVKPGERSEMSAVYASYRDVSGILTPGIARAILLAGPVSAVFAATAVALGATFILAGKLHPRLGEERRIRAETPS